MKKSKKITVLFSFTVCLIQIDFEFWFPFKKKKKLYLILFNKIFTIITVFIKKKQINAFKYCFDLFQIKGTKKNKQNNGY